MKRFDISKLSIECIRGTVDDKRVWELQVKSGSCCLANTV